MKKLILAAIAGALATVQPLAAQQPEADGELAKDMRTFLEWFPGRYDNSLQVFWEPDLNVPEDERHERIHSIFKPVDLPAFGEDVFYVEQYLDGDPAKIYRQRIYSFAADAEEDAIRLKIWTPKDAKKLTGAYREPEKLSGLTAADASNTPGCDVFWKKQANQFLGYMKEGACRFPSKRYGKDIVISDDLVLTENEIWISDRAETVDGEYVFGNKAGISHKLRKIRPFTCWAGVLRDAKHGDDGKGQNDWDFKTGLMFHDQQGEIVLKPKGEKEPREIMLRLRRVEWPTGTNRPSMTLYVHEGGDPRAKSYAWTEYDGERIGINLRWLQASCTHSPDDVFNF